MTAIDDIKSRLDIVEIVSETVKLRRSGRSFTGFCPFHPNTRTPAFAVFPESGTWRCFGQCNEGGDIFKYVMKKEGWDFSEALRYLAERAGVELEPRTPEKQVEEEQHERLHTLLEEAVAFYHHQLLQTPAGQPALAYLKTRGLETNTIEKFGLGYAPDAWETAARYFIQKGYSEELLQVGLVSKRQDESSLYDRFRNRIMFPIRDAGGKMAGFGARIMNPEDVPKFLNSPQTILFDKGRLLYGLDQARKPIRTKDQAVIVEGYLDVIILHQAGYTNVVSPMGTALTEDQLRMLKRFSRRIVLALDADTAGEKATLRGLDVARQAMDRSEDIGFDPRGLLRQEAHLEADLRVTTLPPGKDPDEVVLADPQEWARILESAKPIVIHVMETLANSRDLNDTRVKSEIAAQVLPLIDDVVNPIERDDYRQRLARLLHVDENALMQARPTTGRIIRRTATARMAAKPPQAAGMNPGQAQHCNEMEAYILRVLLRKPETLYRIDRFLQKLKLARLDLQDFENTSHQLLIGIIQQSLEQDEQDSDLYIESHVPDTLQDVARELLTPSQFNEPQLDRLLEETIRNILNLRLIRVRDSHEQLRFVLQDKQEQGESDVSDDLHLFQQYQQVRKILDKALSEPIQLD